VCVALAMSAVGSRSRDELLAGVSLPVTASQCSIGKALGEPGSALAAAGGDSENSATSQLPLTLLRTAATIRYSLWALVRKHFVPEIEKAR
jgi:hypothetical protein